MSERSSRYFILITLAVLVLVTARSHRAKLPTPAISTRLVSWVTCHEAKPQHHIYGDLAEFVEIFHMDLTMSGKTEELSAGAVTPNFFEKIGVKPILGRAFRNGEDQRNHVVILSYRLWQRDFNRSPHTLGSRVTLKNESYEVVGVLPADFRWNNHETDIWLPCNSTPENGFLAWREGNNLGPEI